MVVRPRYDTQRHPLWGDCDCEPQQIPIVQFMTVQGYMITHNSFDGREEADPVGGPV